MNAETKHTGLEQDILLETIVAITEQRDQHSLEMSLCASLREMLQPARILFLDLPVRGPVRTTVPSRNEDVLLPESVLSLAKEMSEYDFRQAEATDMVYMLAVMEVGREGGRRVLLVGMTVWSDNSERLMVGMVRVYQNFMKLMSDSEKDTLTGLQNRRKLESFLASRLTASHNARRDSDKARGANDRSEYLAVLDLDKFKRINDNFGHLIGDEVLLTFANILRASLRDNDRSFRYGGEEFIVVLADVTSTQARAVLERLRGNVEQHGFPQVGQVTVSIGYTLIDRQALPTQIIEEADKALYYAKEHGRNQVRDYHTLLADGDVADAPHDGGIELF